MMTCEEFVSQKMLNEPGLLDLFNKQELRHAFCMAFQAGYDAGFEAGLTLQGSGEGEAPQHG